MALESKLSPFKITIETMTYKPHVEQNLIPTPSRKSTLQKHPTKAPQFPVLFDLNSLIAEITSAAWQFFLQSTLVMAFSQPTFLVEIIS
jgi:hypothetical protein